MEAVRNKGYRIIESPDVLTREELAVQIGDATRWAGRRIVCFTETDSTNVRARKLGENGAAHGTLVVAGTAELPGEDAGAEDGNRRREAALYVASSPGISAEQSADADDRDGL